MKEGPPIARFRRLRRLSDDEIDLWMTVTRSVSPRPGSSLPPRSAALPLPLKEPEAKAPAPPPPESKKAPARPNLPQLTEIDRRLRQKLARGQTSVDAALDLHGMRQPEAHVALHNFLLRAQREGAKVVLVVTGKGDGAEWNVGGSGVLRRSVPLWLRAPEWRSLVVGFEEAARQHGGAGALYVRLRRFERAAGRR